MTNNDYNNHVITHYAHIVRDLRDDTRNATTDDLAWVMSHARERAMRLLNKGITATHHEDVFLMALDRYEERKQVESLIAWIESGE